MHLLPGGIGAFPFEISHHPQAATIGGLVELSRAATLPVPTHSFFTGGCLMLSRTALLFISNLQTVQIVRVLGN